MTAIIGILCQDGVVIGSDSSATFTHSAQFRTIEQIVKKIEVIQGQVILASTGPFGLAQRYHEIIKEYWGNGKGKGKGHIEIGKELCAAAYADFAFTGVRPGQYGALVALPCSKTGAQLCEFSVVDFQPEFKTKSMWFASMGSGQPITDPFLGLMRRVFWPDSMPLLNEGIFAVTWTLNHVIELNPGGINGPPQIAILDSKKNQAKILSDAELAEHTNNAKTAERYLGKYKEILQGKNVADIPEIPQK